MPDENLPLPSSPREQYLYSIANSLINYTYSEFWTGQYWVDGKKIYCKIYKGTTPSVTGNGSIPISEFNIPNTGEVVYTDYVVFSNPYFYCNNPGVLIFYANKNDGSISYIMSSVVAYQGKPFYLLISYTK